MNLKCRLRDAERRQKHRQSYNLDQDEDSYITSSWHVFEIQTCQWQCVGHHCQWQCDASSCNIVNMVLLRDKGSRCMHTHRNAQTLPATKTKSKTRKNKDKPSFISDAPDYPSICLWVTLLASHRLISPSLRHLNFSARDPCLLVLMCDQLMFLCQLTMQVSDLWHPARRCQDNYTNSRAALAREREHRQQQRKNLMKHAEPGAGAPQVAQTPRKLDLGIAEVATPLRCCSVTRWWGLPSLWLWVAALSGWNSHLADIVKINPRCFFGRTLLSRFHWCRWHSLCNFQMALSIMTWQPCQWQCQCLTISKWMTTLSTFNLSTCSQNGQISVV